MKANNSILCPPWARKGFSCTGISPPAGRESTLHQTSPSLT